MTLFAFTIDFDGSNLSMAGHDQWQEESDNGLGNGTTGDTTPLEITDEFSKVGSVVRGAVTQYRVRTSPFVSTLFTFGESAGYDSGDEEILYDTDTYTVSVAPYVPHSSRGTGRWDSVSRWAYMSWNGRINTESHYAVDWFCSQAGSWGTDYWVIGDGFTHLPRYSITNDSMYDPQGSSTYNYTVPEVFRVPESTTLEYEGGSPAAGLWFRTSGWNSGVPVLELVPNQPDHVSGVSQYRKDTATNLSFIWDLWSDTITPISWEVTGNIPLKLNQRDDGLGISGGPGRLGYYGHNGGGSSRITDGGAW